jgi:hypothetical protein
MKTLAVVAVALLAGVAAGTMNTGCQPECPPRFMSRTGGTYGSGAAVPSYRLEVAPGLATAVETFEVDGHTWRLTYARDDEPHMEDGLPQSYDHPPYLAAGNDDSTLVVDFEELRINFDGIGVTRL